MKRHREVDDVAKAKATRKPRTSPGVRPALQQRSREKRDRLIKAGIAAFARDGYEAARIVDIVREAGISVGVFYQRFKDKRGFFDVLEQEFVARGKANWDRFFEEADPTWTARRLLERLTRNLGRVIEDNVGFFRALISLGHHDKSVVGRGVELARYGATRLQEYLVARGLLDPKKIEKDDVYFALAMIHRSLVMSAAMGAGGPYGASEPRTARKLARMLANFLAIDLDQVGRP